MESFAVSFPKLGINLNMTREALVIGDFSIYWYAVLIALGAILAVVYAIYNAKKFGLHPDKIIDVILYTIIAGIIGARAYYVIFNAKEYTTFKSIINIRDGGLAIYGAIIFGFIAIIITCKIFKIKLLPMLDLGASAVLIGQAIGRWGNFVNQEAFGTNTNLPWGMYSEKTAEYLSGIQWDLFNSKGLEVNPTLPVHPCFLYESLWCALGFALAYLYIKHRKFDGEIFLGVGAYYGVGRALIESLRTDSLMIGSMRVSLLLGILIAIVAVVILIYVYSRKRRDPEFLPLYALSDESKNQFLIDDIKVLLKANDILLSAENDIADAKKALDEAFSENSEQIEVESQDELAVMSMSTEDKKNSVLSLAEGKINVAVAKISVATRTAEKYDIAEQPENAQTFEEQEPQDIAEDVAENVSEDSEELSLEERLNEAYALIEDAAELIGETKVKIDNAIQKLTPAKQDDCDECEQESEEEQEKAVEQENGTDN